MDPRIREHAEVVVEHSLDVEAGDRVVVAAPNAAEDFVVALYELLGDIGAKPVRASSPLEGRTNPRASRAYMRARGDADDAFETPEHYLALFEAADAFVILRSYDNVGELADVDPAVRTAASTANRTVQEERLSKPWCLTQFPASGNAQLADMSGEAYENFVWDAILCDWDAQREFQADMVDILDSAEEVRIVSGGATDVTMSVAGNDTLNDYGERNLPGGEVFTAPVPDTVEGEVLFDKPLYHSGREIQDAHLRFEDGEVVDHAAAKNEDVLTEVLTTDEGARRLGELGIGMNRAIDRFTSNMLFDEKMGDTVHMAVGSAYGDTVGEGNMRNESAVHVDMIVDMSEESFIEVDGEVVQRDGTFRFEDGFEE
jgi:aminopeptidase